MILTMKAAGREWLMCDPGGNIGKRMRGGTPYEPNLLEDIRTHHFKGSAFDIGAHVGNHSLYMAMVCDLAVHAFEGDNRLLSSLAENVSLNNANVTIHPYAVGDEPGVGTWYLHGRNKKLRVGRGDVSVRRIDDLVTVDDLAVVKLDIEGMEPHALRGMVKHLDQHPVIYAEVHTPEAERDLQQVLKPFNYKLTGKFEYKGRMQRWE